MRTNVFNAETGKLWDWQISCSAQAAKPSSHSSTAGKHVSWEWMESEVPPFVSTDCGCKTVPSAVQVRCVCKSFHWSSCEIDREMVTNRISSPVPSASIVSLLFQAMVRVRSCFTGSTAWSRCSGLLALRERYDCDKLDQAEALVPLT